MSSRVSSTRVVTTVKRPIITKIETRHRLALSAGAIVILALFAAARTLEVYNTAYQLFNGIVQQDSIRIDASEQALQHIASASTAAADFSSTADTNSAHQNARITIFTEFQQFRDDMFILHTNLDATEQPIYASIEQAVYDDFWPQIGLVIAARQSNNQQAARDAYLQADTFLENQITTALQQLETANFTAMKDAEQHAGQTIITQTLLLALAMLTVAVALTALSVWLRRTLRRFVTPGIDAAAILSWIMLILVVSQLLGLPEALRSMVEDAYYSVTASARVLAIANQGNRAESGALLDVSELAHWQENFDTDKRLVALRICGQANCLTQPFTYADDALVSQTIQNAKAISGPDSISIGQIVPLAANVTYIGEAHALEQARKAFSDYLAIDAKTRQLIANGDMADALVLNTGTQPGQSDEAFSRFSSAMEAEKAINRHVFDSIWNDAQSALTTNRLLFGVACCVLLIVLISVGVYHRFSEL